MFDENKYRACFDEVRAPGSMEREILNMTVKKKKAERAGFSRKLVLIAAVLALMLSFGVVAYAAGWFNLEDAVIGRLDMPENDMPIVVEDGETASNPQEVISLQGVKGSPEYEAAKEWFEYYWSEDYEVVSNSEAIQDPVYNLYGAFSQKSIDKLDSICKKYGLQLNDGPAVTESDINEFYNATGCHGLLKAEAGHSFDGGFWYVCGSFHIEGCVTLDEGWTTPIAYQLVNYAKGYFANGGTLKIGAQEDYAQWEYITANGVPVTMIHAENRDILLVNLENSTLAINIVDLNGYTSGRTKADMEALAECFDFTTVK